MKVMSQKVGSLLTIFALILLTTLCAYAQTTSASIVIVDDISGIKDNKVISAILKAQGVKTQGNTTTFQGNVSGLNQSSVQIDIREMDTQALKLSVSGPISNRSYLISDVDISMLVLDKYYTLTIQFMGANPSLSASMRFRRSSGVTKIPDQTNKNN